MLPFDDIFSIVKEVTSREIVADKNASPAVIRLDASELKAVCSKLFSDERTYFDMLSCITPVDNGPQIGTIEVIYHLYSIPFNHHVGLKVVIPRDGGSVDSLTEIWKTANWHEREAFDMFGITFNGHPDLRRILMPGDWEGHPLRKDYKHQEYYRNIKIDY